MSKKHFIALAKAISRIQDHDERARMADLIGEVCADFNENFNWSTWRIACGC